MRSSYRSHWLEVKDEACRRHRSDQDKGRVSLCKAMSTAEEASGEYVIYTRILNGKSHQISS